MNFKTIRWEDGKVILLDQTKLPETLIERTCSTVEELHEAIKVLATRGAPLLGVTAAYGVCLGLKDFKSNNSDEFYSELKKVGDYIKTSRPTAVNLFWAIDRMTAKANEFKGHTVEELKEFLFAEAELIDNEDKKLCRAIGENGETIIEEGDVILTHCNAGALATAGIGTALAPFYVAHEKGKKFKVYSDETRPLLQGSRLTCWELNEEGIDVTLICDNMAASVMRKGIIKKVIVGADRIAANGDAANKIGTYSVAVLAKEHNIPFYIAAPYSTFDLNCPTGNEIPIEERDPEELKMIGPKQTAPFAVKTYNPAFDVTPHELIKGFITDRGILQPPFN